MQLNIISEVEGGCVMVDLAALTSQATETTGVYFFVMKPTWRVRPTMPTHDCLMPEAPGDLRRPGMPAGADDAAIIFSTLAFCGTAQHLHIAWRTLAQGSLTLHHCASFWLHCSHGCMLAEGQQTCVSSFTYMTCSQMLYVQNGSGLIHIVVARVLHALAKVSSKHTLGIPIAALESGRFISSAPDATDLETVFRNSAMPVMELTRTVPQFWDQPGISCSWHAATTPTSAPLESSAAGAYLAALPASITHVQDMTLCSDSSALFQAAAEAVHCLTASMHGPFRHVSQGCGA